MGDDKMANMTCIQMEVMRGLSWGNHIARIMNFDVRDTHQPCLPKVWNKNIPAATAVGMPTRRPNPTPSNPLATVIASDMSMALCECTCTCTTSWQTLLIVHMGGPAATPNPRVSNKLHTLASAHICEGSTCCIHPDSVLSCLIPEQ